MGCNCGKGQVDKFEVILPTGERRIADSDVQARQWIAKAGGGIMKKVPA